MSAASNSFGGLQKKKRIWFSKKPCCDFSNWLLREQKLGVKLSRTRGLVNHPATSGGTRGDGWCLARWGIPLWLSFSSSLHRSSPSLIGSKWAAVGQTHWLRGFPRELKSHRGRIPLSFCVASNLDRPFSHVQQGPPPRKVKAERQPWSCLCSTRSPPTAAELNPPNKFPRQLLSTHLVCVLLFLQPSWNIWYLEGGETCGRGIEPLLRTFQFLDI